MKKYIKIILFFLSVSMTWSCYKDKGNYNLSEINTISISASGSDSIMINQFDTIRVVPVIDQTMETDDLSYKWSVYHFVPPVSNPINEVLAYTRDLEVPFGLSPNKYTLLYTVTDNKTGVSSFKKYYLEVGNTLSEGWLMISEDSQSQRDIDLLTPDGAVVRNLFSAANPGRVLPAGAHTLRVLTTFFAGSQDIFILGEHDAVRVFHNNFTLLNTMKDWYIETPDPVKPQEFLYDNIGFNAFFVNNGKLYSNQIDFRFSVASAGRYNLSKYIFQSQSSDAAVVYDLTDKRFYAYSSKQLNTFSPEPAAAFDMNNVGMVPIFGGPAPSGQYSYVMVGEDGNPYVLRIHYGGAVGKYKIDNAADILQASHAVFSGLYFHIYYASGNKLYLLDPVNNISKVVFSFSDSEEITALALKQSRSQFVGFPDNNRTIAVGTYTRMYDDLNKPVTLEYKNRK
jgi:hypothetical protein